MKKISEIIEDYSQIEIHKNLYAGLINPIKLRQSIIEDIKELKKDIKNRTLLIAENDVDSDILLYSNYMDDGKITYLMQKFEIKE